VFACAFTADSTLVLSSGWDGCLKLWDVQLGSPVCGFQADHRALSACAISPDGQHWLSGSMDGLLGKWEAATQAQESLFLAHTRPISAVRFAPDGSLLATASWDCSLTLWVPDRPGQGRPLGTHGDIIAGCAFTPDGRRLVAWSYDHTASIWDVSHPQRVAHLHGHTDRLTAGGVAPDGRWLATGARDRQVRLWSLTQGREAANTILLGEARACLFLRDGESLVVVDAAGRLTLHRLPDLQVCSELHTSLPVQCAELAPSGATIALGCRDGRLGFVAVEGFDQAPLTITATQTLRTPPGGLRRLFSRAKPKLVYLCTCPACRQSFELPGTEPDQSAACPGCSRHVRVGAVTQQPEPAASHS
jgi:WD40 repeat protein